jgi:tetratricopeptide (TPR) repeat protein
MTLNFEERAEIFSEYKELLEQIIDSDFKNIETFCLLAMVLCELREDTDLSLKVLEECYDKNKDTFTDDGYALWATDIAYFFIEECGKEKEKQAVELLQNAALRNSKFPNTYYALGKYYFENKSFEMAAEWFHKAFTNSEKRIYSFSEAISLLADSRLEEGIKILESLYVYPFENEEQDAKVALTLGRELALRGDIERAKKIANLLMNTSYQEFDIEIDEMADYLYILEEYKACVDLYDKCNFLEDADWLNKYFYSLKQLGKFEEALEKLHDITEKIKLDVLEEQSNPSDYENEEDLEYYISSERKRLDEIWKCYNEIFSDDIVPKSDTYYDILYECYYINCPRHHIG